MGNFMLWSTLICSTLVISTELSPNPLNGQHLRVIWPLWQGNPKGLSGPLKGGVMLDYFTARFNFTYEMVRVTENAYEPTAYGKGLFSFLIENKSDFIVEAIAPNSARYRTVDLTQPWTSDIFSALIPVAEVGANTNAIIKPFQWQVWISLGISIVIVIIVLNRVVPNPLVNCCMQKSVKTQSKNSSSTRANKKQIPDQFLYVFGNLLSQGGPCKSKRLSFRLVAGCWGLVTFVLVQAYTSTLLTYVVVPVSSPLINSVYDVTKKDDTKLLIRKNGGVESILTGTNQSQELFKNLLERINLFPDSRCKLRSECINLVKPGSKNVYLDGKPYILDAIKERYEKTGKCDLQLAKKGFLSYLGVFALQKRSPYTSSINRGIMELHQMGLVDHWDSWFRPMPPKCQGKGETRIKLSSAEKDLSRLSLRNLTGAFVILATGLTISCLIFLTELLVNLVFKGLGQN